MLRQKELFRKLQAITVSQNSFARILLKIMVWDKITRRLEMGDLVRGRQYIFTRGKLHLTN